VETKSICELVREAEHNDTSGETTTSKYVQVNMREEIDTVDAYLNSKHTSGKTDSMDREKPFFNVVIAARNIWYRATDIDRKDIRVKATKLADMTSAFLATLLLGEWMKTSYFGRYLNDWGLALANYGSCVSKFIEKKGELHCDVVSWNRLLVDPVDFEGNIKIEKLWFTPAQLKKKKEYDQKLVKKLLNDLTTRKTPDGQSRDTKSGYIPLYEVHGELPLSLLTDNENDEDTHIQQMHVITFLEKKDKKGFDDYTLYSGREAKDPYLIAHLIKQDGYTLSGGAVKNLFDVQWMENHTAKTIKDQLDLASKMIFQTSDGNFVGQNVLSSIEQGDILIHQPNQALTQLNNKADIGALQSYGQQWKSLGNELVGVSEAMLGVAPKSGTAWRQTEAILQENHSLFQLMTENKGLHLTEALIKFIIPHIKKKMDTTKEISAILQDHQITQLDSMYVPNEAIRRNNRKIIDRVLSDEDTRDLTPEWQTQDTAMEAQGLQQGLNSQGNQRFIKPSDIKTRTWKDEMKDLEWELDIDITGEQRDTQAVMTTLTTVLQTIAQNPMILQDQNMKLLFNKILSETGAISPLELSQISPVSPTVGGPMAGAETVAIK